MPEEIEELTCYSIRSTEENPIGPRPVELLVTRGLTSGKVLLAIRMTRKANHAAVE